MISDRERDALEELDEVEQDFYCPLMFLALSRLVSEINIRAELGEASISQENVKEIVKSVYADLNERSAG